MCSLGRVAVSSIFCSEEWKLLTSQGSNLSDGEALEKGVRVVSSLFLERPVLGLSEFGAQFFSLLNPASLCSGPPLRNCCSETFNGPTAPRVKQQLLILVF